jgi:hypothetical protein
MAAKLRDSFQKSYLFNRFLTHLILNHFIRNDDMLCSRSVQTDSLYAQFHLFHNPYSDYSTAKPVCGRFEGA